MSTRRGSPDRELLGELFERALELEPHERATFLEAAVPGDDDLRAELTSLLASHAASPAFLEQLGAQVLPAVLGTSFGEIPPGQRVAGRYEIIERLGGGGMGVVYKARDLALDRLVALKFPPPLLSRDPVARDRLKREAKAASALDHPNIAVVYDIGETSPDSGYPEDGGLFIAMGYYPGETLRERIGRAPLAVHQAVDYATQLADALAAAHNAGIIHRDIKPANLVVTEDDVIKLVDFGVAKVIRTGLTGEGTTSGTLAYMSPEQTLGDPLDQRTDIWSLGVVLYEMLAGVRPFRGDADAVVHRIRHEEPEPLASIRPDVPRELTAIVVQCLAKDPALRYDSADALLAELREVAPGALPVDANAPVSDGAPTVSRPRGWKGLVMLMGAAGLATAFGAKWLVSMRSPGLHADRVIVAPFENRTGDAAHDPFGGIAAERITHAVQRAGIAAVVPFDVARASADHVGSLADGSAGRSEIQSLAGETGAGLVITGTYYRRGDSLHVEAAITGARQRRVLPLEPVRAPAGELSAAVELLGQRTLAGLAQILETRLPPDMRFRERPPLNYEAYLARVAGWEAEARVDPEEAFLHYDRALALDPTDLNTVLRSAWLGMNYRTDLDVQQRAWVDSLLNVAKRGRDRLVPADQAWLDFLIARQGRDRVQVYEAAKRWAALSPGATVASWNWALEALRSNRPREAIRILGEIDPDRFAQGHFHATDYWITLIDSYHLIGDHRREVNAARRALARHPDDRVLLLSGAIALAARGRIVEARAMVDARLALRRDLWPPPLLTLGVVGHELQIHAKGEEARAAGREMFERAIALYHTLPAAEKGAFEPLMHYGLTLERLGRLPEAEAAFRAAAAVSPEESLPGMAIWANGMVGMTAARRGDLAEVARIEQWLAGDRHPWGLGSVFRACIAAELGRKDDAVALLRRAFSEGMYRNPASPRFHLFPCFDSLLDYRPFQQLIRPRG